MYYDIHIRKIIDSKVTWCISYSFNMALRRWTDACYVELREIFVWRKSFEIFSHICISSYHVISSHLQLNQWCTWTGDKLAPESVLLEFMTPYGVTRPHWATYTWFTLRSTWKRVWIPSCDHHTVNQCMDIWLTLLVKMSFSNISSLFEVL